MPNLTAEQRYILQMLGNDVDNQMLSDPAYKNEMIRQNMKTPNSVVDPRTGQYLGEYEMMPQSLLSPMSDQDAAMMAAMQANAGGMAGMTGGNNLGGAISNQDARFIEQNMANSGNQIIDQSRFNLSALLKRLGMQ